MKTDYESMLEIYAGLNEIVKQMINYIKESKNIVNKMNNNGHWDGNGFEYFNKKFSDLSQNHGAYCNELYKLNNNIKNSMEKYKKVDKQVSEAVTNSVKSNSTTPSNSKNNSTGVSRNTNYTQSSAYKKTSKNKPKETSFANKNWQPGSSSSNLANSNAFANQLSGEGKRLGPNNLEPGSGKQFGSFDNSSNMVPNSAPAQPSYSGPTSSNTAGTQTGSNFFNKNWQPDSNSSNLANSNAFANQLSGEGKRLGPNNIGPGSGKQFGSFDNSSNMVPNSAPAQSSYSGPTSSNTAGTQTGSNFFNKNWQPDSNSSNLANSNAFANQLSGEGKRLGPNNIGPGSGKQFGSFDNSSNMVPNSAPAQPSYSGPTSSNTAGTQTGSNFFNKNWQPDSNSSNLANSNAFANQLSGEGKRLGPNNIGPGSGKQFGFLKHKEWLMIWKRELIKMAYENIDTDKMKTSLSKLDNINYDKVNDLIGKLQTDQWQSPSRKRIINALKVIVQEIKQIDGSIKTYKTATELIEDYKDYDKSDKKNESEAKEAKKKYDEYNSKVEPTIADENFKKFYKKKYEDCLSKSSSSNNNKKMIKNKINSLVN